MNKKKFERKLWKKIDKVTEVIKKKYPDVDYWDISGFVKSNRRNVYITVTGNNKNIHTQDIYREVEHDG